MNASGPFTARAILTQPARSLRFCEKIAFSSAGVDLALVDPGHMPAEMGSQVPAPMWRFAYVVYVVISRPKRTDNAGLFRASLEAKVRISESPLTRGTRTFESRGIKPVHKNNMGLKVGIIPCDVYVFYVKNTITKEGLNCSRLPERTG